MCKKKNCSLNEAMQACLSQALKQYSLNRNDDSFKTLNICTTFSLVNFPTKREELRNGNHWVFYDYHLPVSSSFQNNLLAIREVNNKLKGSTRLIGMEAASSLALWIPFNFPKHFFNYLTTKITMGYSNVPSPTQNYNFGGKRCNDITVFLPSVGEVVCGLIAVSHGNTIKLGFHTDKHFVDDPQEFMNLV